MLVGKERGSTLSIECLEDEIDFFHELESGRVNKEQTNPPVFFT